MIRFLVWLLLIAALIVGGVLAYRHVTGTLDPGGRQATEARVDTGRADAAIQSGADAANTVKDASDREAASEALTRENERAIRDAEGSDEPVAKPVRDAGLAALCRRVAYRDSARCAAYR